MKLLLGDILDEGRLEGEYDLVNVRALVSVLENREWEVVVRNLVRTLSQLAFFMNSDFVHRAD